MATNNKKVSGYLPQYLFDVFEGFREKRSLSASSALITILSEYFQADQKVDHQISILSGDDFVSKEQFEVLEVKFSELSSSLPSELETMFNSLRSELLNSLPKAIEVETVNIESELLSELQDVPLSKLPSESIDEPLSELVSEPEEDTNSLQLDIIDVDADQVQIEEGVFDPEKQLIPALSEALKPLPGKLLAKRLSTKATILSTNTKKMPEVRFYSWLKTNDCDKISWQPVGGDLKKRISGWIPAENTSSELLGRLKEWLSANPE